MKKKVKIFVLVCILFLGVNITTTNTQFSQPAFASMGSTGGGHSTGGSSGGGGSSSGGSSHSSSHDTELNPYILALGLAGGIIYFILEFYPFISYRNKFNKLAKHLYKKYDSLFLLDLGSPTKNRTAPADYGFQMFSPNLTIKQFESLLAQLRIKLSVDNIDNLDKSFTEVYIKAQYLYSQLLRERYVNHNYQLNSLKQYLDDSYYKTMTQEIDLKVSQGTVDETIIDQVKVAKYAKLDNNLILAKLEVTGQDKEIQFNKGFEDSFARNQWSDYVIFGKTKNNSYKIITLVYGEHFHLNGTDYNQQPGLSKAKYKEKRI